MWSKSWRFPSLTMGPLRIDIIKQNEIRGKLLLWVVFQAMLAYYLLLAERSFDSHTLIFLFDIFFSFSSQLLPLPVLLFQRRGMNRASWIPTQRGEGQHSSSLPRHLICGWQPADRMEGRGEAVWGWRGGAGEGKGYRMGWGKYKMPLGAGDRLIGGEMLKNSELSSLFALFYCCFLILKDAGNCIRLFIVVFPTHKPLYHLHGET